jgi:anti-sigma factor RsiW
MTFYLDDELETGERAVLEAHLLECGSCRTAFEEERIFLQLISSSGPLHLAPPRLQERVKELLGESDDVPLTPPRLRRRIERLLQLPANSNRRQSSPQRRLVSTLLSPARVPGLVAITIVGLLLATLLLARLSTRRIPSPSDFAQMAVDTHLRHLRGQLPLEVVSDGPDRISQWFQDKVPFGVKLPTYQESSGQEKVYALQGARLVGYKGDYAAFVAYQMQHRQISLVITSESVAQPAGGEEITAKGITFHYDTIAGLKVITWSDRGLTYALVSNLEERGQESCVVCHQGTKDRDFIEKLKPMQNLHTGSGWRLSKGKRFSICYLTLDI